MEITELLNTNLKGVFLCSQSAETRGKTLNLCSEDALKPSGIISHYNAFKGDALLICAEKWWRWMGVVAHVSLILPWSVVFVDGGRDAVLRSDSF